MGNPVWPTPTVGFGATMPSMAPNYAYDMSQFGASAPGNTANIAVPGASVAAAPALPSMEATTQQIMSQAGLAGGDAAGAGAEGIWGRMGGMEGLGSIFEGLGQIGQIWGAMQGVKLAREQLNFSKSAYDTNLTNQTQSYNTELEDRQRARASFTGASESDIDAYLKKNSL